VQELRHVLASQPAGVQTRTTQLASNQVAPGAQAARERCRHRRGVLEDAIGVAAMDHTPQPPAQRDSRHFCSLVGQDDVAVAFQQRAPVDQRLEKADVVACNASQRFGQRLGSRAHTAQVAVQVHRLGAHQNLEWSGLGIEKLRPSGEQLILRRVVGAGHGHVGAADVEHGDGVRCCPTAEASHATFEGHQVEAGLDRGGHEPRLHRAK